MRLILSFLRGIRHELVTLLVLFVLAWLVLVFSNVSFSPVHAQPTPLPSDAECTPPAVMMELQCVAPTP